MLLLFLPAHIASDQFNLTSFAILSDAGGDSFEMIEANLDEYAGGGGPTFDRVVANEHGIYVRMYVRTSGKAWSLVIMTDNDILQMKYIAHIWGGINVASLSIGNLVHIIINNVKQNMGTSIKDVAMNNGLTTITIGSGSNSNSRGTWTSTIEPDNVTVELDCAVVNNNNSIITAKCNSDTTWGDSVFNRIPIYINEGGAKFGFDGNTNQALFGIDKLPIDGLITQKWDGSTLYNVDGSGSNLTIGEQFTIKDLPSDFVSHWVDTIHAKAYMGDARVMLVPPGSS